MAENKKHSMLRVPIFEKLDFNEMAIVEKFVFSCNFEEGEVIFNEGSHGRSMYFVVDGVLDVIKKKEDSDEKVLITEITQGHSVGELALIDGFVRSAMIKAKTNGVFIALKREDFETLQDKHPKIAIKIVKGIARVISLNLRKTSLEITKLMMPIT